MIGALLLILLLLLTLLLWFFLFPLKRVGRAILSDELVEPPETFVYSYVLHIHTQFSYDSLGKPEDVIRVRDALGIDYAVVTDHDSDAIRWFADERLIAGREVKLNDGEGRLQGDLLEIGDLKVVAHHFRGKYRWRLEKSRDLLFELVDLRDALLERKRTLVLYLLSSFILYPFLKDRVISGVAKLVDTRSYARRYLSEGWRSKIVGGLDHHVKVYIREVRRRVMIPAYEHSFSIMRNFVLSPFPVRGKDDLIRAIREGTNVISFSDKPSFVWSTGRSIRACSPFSNTYMVLISDRLEEREILGPNLSLHDLERGYYIILGYTYTFRFGRMLFGVRPLFVSDLLEVT